MTLFLWDQLLRKLAQANLYKIQEMWGFDWVSARWLLSRIEAEYPLGKYYVPDRARAKWPPKKGNLLQIVGNPTFQEDVKRRKLRLL